MPDLFAPLLRSAAAALNDHPRGYALWIGGVLVGLVVGGAPERIAAAALAVNIVASLALNSGGAVQTPLLLLIEDALVASVLASLLWRYPRRWLLWALALQLITVAVHLPRILPTHFGQAPLTYAYALAQSAAGYALILALLLGALTEALTRAQKRDQPRSL